MVVSDRHVERTTGGIAGLERLTGILHGPILECLRHALNVLTQTLRPPAYPRVSARGRTVRYVTMSTQQPDVLLERSTLLFRRENQGESFDEDVLALRDQAGSGRREQSDPDQLPADDQTTYSPPQQTWTPASTIPATTPYQAQETRDPEPVGLGAASVIAKDTRWSGTVESSGSIHVHGNVQGEISTEGDLHIAESATVSANVRAGAVTVAGTLEGTVVCSGRFEVLPTGRVSADVGAPRLVVHEGAVVVGQLRMTTEEQGTG